MDVLILGALQVCGGGRPIQINGTRRRSLLGRLLLSANRVVAADVLIEDVWGGAVPGVEATLQTSIYQLRRLLGGDGERLRTEANGYSFAVGSEELDASRFEALLARARDEELDVAARADLLAAAAALWRGPVLGELTDATWAQAEAARLDALRADAEDEWAELQLTRGRHLQLVAHLEGAVGRQPLRERRSAQLMAALYRSGRQADALRVYRCLRQRLVDELGIEPTAALAGLEAAILAQDPALDLPSSPLGPTASDGTEAAVLRPAPPARRSGIFGRERELAALREAREAAVGERRVVLIEGDPGVGKTRLAAEAAGEAAAAGAVVLWGRCDEDVVVAFQPFAEALGDYLRTAPPAQAAEALGVDRNVLAHLLPGVTARAETPPVDAVVDRAMLFDAVATMLDRLAQGRRLVFVIDDLHWVSAPTALLLRHWMRRAIGTGVLVIGTLRPGEIGTGHALSALLAELADDPATTHLGIADLEVADLEHLAREIDAGSETDLLAIARAVHDRTHGNALYSTQLLRALADTAGGLPCELLIAGGRAVPASLRHIVAGRLSGLPEGATDVLRVAAVMGAEFDLAPLEAAVSSHHFGVDGVLALLEAALDARLLEELPVPGRFRFVHALVRDGIDAELSNTRRMRLHCRIATALAAAGAPAPAVAHHYAAAAAQGGRAEAIEWLDRAAVHYRTHHAYEDAVEAYQRLLELIEGAPSSDRADSARVHLELANTLALAGDIDGSMFQAEAAAIHARAIGDTDLFVRAVMDRVAYGRVGVPDPVGRELLCEALAEVRSERLDLRAYVLAHLAFYEAVMEGRGSSADPVAQEAVAQARQSGDEGAIADALGVRAFVLQGSSDLDAQRATLDELRRFSHVMPSHKDRGIEWVQTTWLRHEGVIRLQAGDRQHFLEAMAELSDRGECLHSWLMLSITEMWQALLAALEGRWHDATRHSDSMVHKGRGDVDFQLSWSGLHFILAREQGALAELGPLVLSLVQQVSQPATRAPELLLHLDCDRLDEARIAAESLVEYGLNRVAHAVGGSVALAALAEVYSRVDDPGRAAAVEDRLRPYAGQLLVVAWGVYVVGAADRYLGMLASRRHCWREADQLFASALALEESVGSRPLATRTRVCWARSLLDRPDVPGPTQALLARAASDATALGMARLTDEIRGITARVPRRAL
jgi:DNA-binding SARP family transcriptional activator